MKISRRLFLLSPLALAYKPSWGSVSFPLPQGHFVPAKMPMHAVYPRPDSETQAHARHRWAHPDFRYEIPIGVQGGAWPFKYEIIAGPEDATIGQYYGDPDYGVLKWMPANGDSGTKSFTVRVTDQELNTVDLSWSTTIDPAQFVFIDSSTASTGNGSINDPLKTFSDWYKGDRADSTYHNKIIVFRGGLYNAFGSTETNGNVRLDYDSKTPSLIGYPDEEAIIDCSQAKFFTDTNLHDIFIGGIKFKNARTDVGNPHFFWATGDWHRATWYDVTFDTLGMGTSNNDNPAAVFTTAKGIQRQNLLFKNLIFENFSATGSNGGFIDLFYANYVLVEGCIARNSKTTYGIWMKGTPSFVTIRNNDLSQNVSGIQVTLGYGSEIGPGTPHDHEICWNNFVSADGGDIARITAKGNQKPDSYNTFIYRNTFANGHCTLRYPGVTPFETDGNVATETETSFWDYPSRITVKYTPNLVGIPSDGITDSSGRLTGKYRNKYLGLVGHEVSSSLTKVPTPPSLKVY